MGDSSLLSEAEDKAADIMDADGVPFEHQVKYLAGWRATGADPIASADHIVNLRKALRDG